MTQLLLERPLAVLSLTKNHHMNSPQTQGDYPDFRIFKKSRESLFTFLNSEVRSI